MMEHKTTSITSLILITFLLVFGICTSYSIADDLDWPRWRGPNGDGISMETNWGPEVLTGGPKMLWKADVGWGYSNVVTKDNRLYTMGKVSREFVVFCFNAETGEEIWRNSIEGYYEPQSTPTIEDKYVYALSSTGTLLCLKAKNGKLRWKKDTCFRI